MMHGPINIKKIYIYLFYIFLRDMNIKIDTIFRTSTRRFKTYKTTCIYVKTEISLSKKQEYMLATSTTNL